MVFPTKKDIENTIKSLEIHVDACAEYDVVMTSKRIGGLIAMSESSGYISKDEAKDCHNKANQIIRKFRETCSCTHK